MRSQGTNTEQVVPTSEEVSRGAARERLVAATEALAGSGPETVPTAGTQSPYWLAGQVLGRAMTAAKTAGDDAFPGAMVHTVTASGIEQAMPEIADRLALVEHLAGSLFDLTLGLGSPESLASPDLRTAARLFMAMSELAAMRNADEDDPETTERRTQLRERIHGTAVRLALFAENDVAGTS